MNAPKRYWMVHGHGMPSHMHESYESAAKEAKRLARVHPGQTFVVLESVKAFRKIEIQEMDMDGDYELPF